MRISFFRNISLASDPCTLLLRLLLTQQTIDLNSEDALTNAILFIDFKKGFADTINHEILVSKLGLDEFKEASLNFFRDYLSDRTQVTVINKVNCETSY